MDAFDYHQPWYHGSPDTLDVLREGSWVTQFKEMAKAFSHKPSYMSLEDDCSTIKHNGKMPGRLYVVCEEIRSDDVVYLADTAGTHWQTQRDLRVALLEELSIDDPPQMTAEELAEMRKVVPEGTTAFIGDPD